MSAKGAYLPEEPDDYSELVRQLGERVFEARGSRCGWLTPEAVFISTGYGRHDIYARSILGVEGTYLEANGWIKISLDWEPKLAPGAELTERQAAFLLTRTG